MHNYTYFVIITKQGYTTQSINRSKHYQNNFNPISIKCYLDKQFSKSNLQALGELGWDVFQPLQVMYESKNILICDDVQK